MFCWSLCLRTTRQAPERACLPYRDRKCLTAAAVVAGITIIAVAAECAEEKDQDQPVAGIGIAAENTVIAAAIPVVAKEQ